jgi:hypothetical protein
MSDKMSKETKERIHENLKPGALEQFGYSMHESAEKRHEALKRAIEASAPLKVFHEVLIQKTWHKNDAEHPELEEIAQNDLDWIKERYNV